MVAVAALGQSSSVEAGHLQIYGYLFHPTGNSTTAAWLYCGWHGNCDGDYPDLIQPGLDWVWEYYSKSEVRLRLRFRGTETYTHVANGHSFYENPSNCPRYRTIIKRISDGAWIGEIRDNHAKGSEALYSFYAGPTVQYDWAVASMVHPADDNCSSFRHVMQEFYLEQAGNIVSKNTNLPGESACYRCNEPYTDPWSPVEYIFGFVHH